MSKRTTVTDALKQAVRDSGESLYSICKATGANEDSLARFMRNEQSLRLDVADRLAEYLGIVIKRRPARRKAR